MEDLISNENIDSSDSLGTDISDSEVNSEIIQDVEKNEEFELNDSDVQLHEIENISSSEITQFFQDVRTEITYQSEMLTSMYKVEMAQYYYILLFLVFVCCYLIGRFIFNIFKF